MSINIQRLAAKFQEGSWCKIAESLQWKVLLIRSLFKNHVDAFAKIAITENFSPEYICTGDEIALCWTLLLENVKDDQWESTDWF